MDRKYNVLVVEDNQIARMSLGFILAELGCIHDFSETGKDGIAKASQKKYDLILMDIGLEEGMDGFIVTERIKKEENGLNNDTPVVALTAHKEDGYRLKAQEVGMIDFKQKPMDAETLKQLLSLYVENK